MTPKIATIQMSKVCCWSSTRRCAEQHDGREQPAVGHGQQLDPHADQRQVQDDQHRVADPHRGDQAPEQLRVAGHHLRARLDVVDGHRAHHQRHHGVGRDAQRQQRDEGGLRAGVVGRLGRRDAADVALAERHFARRSLVFFSMV
jgi:hypothetical protein